jgi:hypothetical protein
MMGHNITNSKKTKQKKGKRKRMLTPTERQERGRPATAMPSGEVLLGVYTPNYYIPNITFNKENDNDVIAARTNPRDSPDT